MDNALVAAADGDEVGSGDAPVDLAALCRGHHVELVRLARLLLDDDGSAEETVQEAYVRVQLAARRLRDPGAALAYLRATVVNLSRSRLRRRLVAARHSVTDVENVPSAEADALGRERRQLVVAALRSLPCRQREAVALRFYAELSEPEIAAAMGLSLGAVKSHLRRGKAALTHSLEGVL